MTGADAASRAGDPVRLAMDRYQRPLTLYALRLLGGADLDRARDVVQDTFARLIAEGGRASHNGHLAAWLYAVCRNRALDLRRRERRMTLITDDSADATLASPAPGPAQIAEARDATSRVLALLDRLPPNQQEVLRLKFQHGLSYREIAFVTKLSESNVGFLIHTGLRTLRERMNARE